MMMNDDDDDDDDNDDGDGDDDDDDDDDPWDHSGLPIRIEKLINWVSQFPITGLQQRTQ